jgi:hypothetical protein
MRRPRLEISSTITDHPLRLAVGNFPRFQISLDNSIQVASGASCTAGGVWTNASSRELKEDIIDLSTDQAMDALDKLKPVIYKYKADKEGEHAGFSAEDVPDLVASKDRKGMSSMDVVAVLIKVLQEQQKINEELRSKITELEVQLKQDN